MDDATLYARNAAFIPTGVQAAMRQSVIYAAGSGLASTIVELACRTGFTRFILADGDTVELSNLNRQAFTHAQIGQNKAAATADLLQRIRPDVTVEVVPRMLDEVTCLEPLARADLVINSLDFDQPAIFALNRAAQAANKPVLQPVNLGWGGAVLIFNAETPTLEQFLEVDLATVDYDAVLRRFIERVVREIPGGLPDYLAPLLAQFQTDRAWWRESPQLGVAAHLTSALAVRALVALVARAPVRVVPRVVHCDVRALLEPAG
ncbi:MAG TPA: ThiF family adenylyltransferase [Ktedonobacterales bacterium]|nr:ThiF family adenylyltransferase [Ktedonobacterales bacterium]